jgi:replicative DNA helicase
VAEAQDAAAAEVLALGLNSSGGSVSLSAAARRRAEDYMRPMSGEDLAGIETPWREMNRIIGGMKPGQMIVIGARPSMGKSAMAADLVEHASGRLGMHTGVISMEMSTDEWVDRLVSRRGRVSLSSITNGHATAEESRRVLDGVAQIEQWPVTMNDAPSQSITQIRSWARRLHARNPLDLLIIDYLQLCAFSDPNENSALTTISRGIKALARELKIPIVALSQLSRDLEKRPNKRPMMSDLRGSGGIEQDADVIVFIYRDEKYHPETEDRGVAEAIVAKQRNGPTDVARLAFNDEHATFRDLAPAYRDIRDYQPRGGRHAAD